MEQRVSMIMTGAKDIPQLRNFYEAGLGFSPWMPASPQSVMYKVGHSVLVFLNADYLAQESGTPIGPNAKTALAVFVEAKGDVQDMFDRAIRAGASATSPVRDRDGGLYSGYFADPEGNSWEIVWSPHMPLDDQGALTLPRTT